MQIAHNVKKTISNNGAIRCLAGSMPLPQLLGDEPVTGDPVIARTRTLLTNHSDDLHFDGSEAGLGLIGVQESPLGRHIRFYQQKDDIPIFGSEVAVQVKDENVMRVSIARYHDCEATNGIIREQSDTDLTEEDVMNVVRQDLGEYEEVESHFSNTWFPTDAGLKPSFLLDIVTTQADWRYVIDRHTSEILFKADRREEISGTGMVFAPNPVVTAHNTTFKEGITPNATLNAELVSVTLNDITKSGTKYQLKGPYVQIKNKQPVNINPPEPVTPTFNYQRTDSEFEAVNVYYHIDKLQRYIQNDLGITSVMNWSIEADHHTATDGGAFYSPGGKYLGFGGSGASRPDRGEDGDVMAHEYGHAIQHDMVPAWGGFNATTGRNEARAMGEGFGDALACIFNYEAGGIFQPEVFEDWIFAPAGLRRVDGVKNYPGEGTVGNVAAWTTSVHANGEIWSSPIWQAYLAAGGNSGSPATRSQARKHILKTLILHHFKLAGSESMPEAAEALLETNAELDGIRGRELMPLLDAFHDRHILRCSPGVDLWIKDKPSHTGSETVSGTFWNSPDLWIRNNNDGGTAHQAPDFGQDNYFHCRVRNRGTATARAFVVTFEVKIWQGTQFSYKTDYVPFISAAVGFNLAPGASTVVKAKWPAALVPSAGSHGCLLVSAYTPTDEAILGKHAWDDNNLAQKNLTIVDLLPDQAGDMTFRIGNLNNRTAERFRVEVQRPAGREDLQVAIVHRDRRVLKSLFSSLTQVVAKPVLQPITPVAAIPVFTTLLPTRLRLGDGGMEMNLAAGSEIFSALSTAAEEAEMDEATFNQVQADFDEQDDATGLGAITFKPGLFAGFPTVLQPRSNPPLKLRVKAPGDARPGDTFEINVMQRNRRGTVVGGVTIQVRIK